MAKIKHRPQNPTSKSSCNGSYTFVIISLLLLSTVSSFSLSTKCIVKRPLANEHFKEVGKISRFSSNNFRMNMEKRKECLRKRSLSSPSSSAMYSTTNDQGNEKSSQSEEKSLEQTFKETEDETRTMLKMQKDPELNQENEINFIRQLKDWMKTQQLIPPSSPPLPIEIEDFTVLYYDIFLLLNLSVSISFWVVHRLSFLNIIEAFSEGCLLCILWIISGLYNGAFLYSAVDGHYDMSKEEYVDKGGPKAAGLLGLWTFVGTINMRLVVALVMAVLDHRRVGVLNNGEELIPLELCFGLVLMSMWRMLHSTYTRV